MTWVYRQTEKPGWFPSPKQEHSFYLDNSLWTVGFYDPDGTWHPDSDYSTPKEAAERVHYLNGGK